MKGIKMKSNKKNYNKNINVKNDNTRKHSYR